MIPQITINVMDTMWPVLVLCSVVFVTFRLTYLFNNKEKFVLYKELINFTFIIYILLLFEIVTSTDYFAFGNNFVPFKEMFRYPLDSPYFLKNVIGNMALFVPLGYFVSYFCKINKFYLIMLVTALVSLTIEIIQSRIGRAFDIDDIMLNVAGGLVGYFIYKISDRLLEKYPDTFKNSLFLNLVFLIIMFLMVLIILRVYEVI